MYLVYEIPVPVLALVGQLTVFISGSRNVIDFSVMMATICDHVTVLVKIFTLVTKKPTRPDFSNMSNEM
jgi:hypothetical protein